MNIRNAGIHLDVEPDVAAESSTELKRKTRPVNDEICTKKGMTGICKNRTRENVPPRQGIFTLPSTRAPCCWRGGGRKYYSRPQKDMRMSAIVDRQEVVVIRRC